MLAGLGVAQLRFRLYRWVIARATARDFAKHQVLPLEEPQEEEIEVRPLDERLLRLWQPTSFPVTEHAGRRLRSARLSGFLLPLIARIPASRTGQVAGDLEGLLEQIYPARYRKIWGTPPAMPPEFEAEDVLAALAVSSPFAVCLQRASAVAELPEEADAGPDDFVIDMRCFDGVPVKEGLLAPGGVAVFRAADGHLVTSGILSGGELHEPGAPGFDRAFTLMLCALNTHLTTLLHNAGMHLGYVTPFAVATSNMLGSRHPLRRLLHPALQTVVVGNYQLARFQIVGRRAFATTLFSYDHDAVMALVEEYLAAFRVAHLDPAHRYERDGLTAAGVELPQWQSRLALWEIVHDYVEKYVAHYYADDHAVAVDGAVTRWTAELDRLLPAGLYDDEGYLTRGGPLGRAELTRLCAAFLHTSSVTHDIVNNAVWNYTPLSHVIPTQVPESGERQDVRVSFDLMNTLIGTWKTYNMLLDGCSHVALDEEAGALMDEYVAALRRHQEAIDARGAGPGEIQPRNLNPSVSN